MGRAIVNIIVPVEVQYDEQGQIEKVYTQLDGIEWSRIWFNPLLRASQKQLDIHLASGEQKACTHSEGLYCPTCKNYL